MDMICVDTCKCILASYGIVNFIIYKVPLSDIPFQTGTIIRYAFVCYLVWGRIFILTVDIL